MRIGRVVVVALDGLGVEAVRPGVVLAGGVWKVHERAAELFVGAPAERRGLAFARLVGDGGLAGVGSERVAVRVAGGAVGDLGQQFRRGDDAGALLEQREADVAVGVLARSARDLPLANGTAGAEDPEALLTKRGD